MPECRDYSIYENKLDSSLSRSAVESLIAGNNVVLIIGVLSLAIRENYHNCYNTTVRVNPRSSFEAANKFNGTFHLFDYYRNCFN